MATTTCKSCKPRARVDPLFDAQMTSMRQLDETARRAKLNGAAALGLLPVRNDPALPVFFYHGGFEPFTCHSKPL